MNLEQAGAWVSMVFLKTAALVDEETRRAPASAVEVLGSNNSMLGIVAAT